MKLKNPFKELTKGELVLWLTSLAVVSVSFLIPHSKDYLTLIASLIGVTALIFVAKGFVIGQVLTVVFAVFYGIISFYLKYYGEVITYVCMTAPMAVMSIVSWVRHPYKDTNEVEVNRMSKKQVGFMLLLTAAVTTAFYFILSSLGTASVVVSTVSVTTSFLAVYMTYMRSPYYAIGYSANDIVLIILWTIASLKDIANIPMVLCFVMFLANDIYGFINWRKMQKKQGNN